MLFAAARLMARGLRRGHLAEARGTGAPGRTSGELNNADSVNRVAQFLPANWLRQAAIHSRFHAVVPVYCRAMRGHSIDRNVPARDFFPLTDEPCRFQTIHIRAFERP